MSKKPILATLAMAALLMGCGHAGQMSEQDGAEARIDSLESSYFNNPETKGTPKTGMALVRQYAAYYEQHKEDSLALDRLFKAGEVSMGIRQGNLAVKYFKTLAEQHRDYARAPESLFLCGFCSETLNLDTSAARSFYQKFIKTYPTHHLVEDAKFSILNLGKSDEELIKEFQQNRKDKEDY